MNKTNEAAADIATGEAAPHLGRALASRHVAMISIGGIIGAGLFVGSSAAIATVGPAAVVSYVLAGVLVLLDDRGRGGSHRRRHHPAGPAPAPTPAAPSATPR